MNLTYLSPLANHLWQSTLFAGAAWLLVLALRRHQAQVRYWVWFIASQVAFGIVAGIVVMRHSRVRTRENMPFALRAGIEAPGMMPPHGENRP